MNEIETIKINDVEYVKKNDIQQMAERVDGMQYIICRTYSSGVFAGYLKKREGQEVTLLNARRLWQWYGAASLSQLAMEGVSKPNDCKFPCEVNSVLLLNAIEIVECTEKARLSIKAVNIWKV